ncbi:transcriptional activator cmr1 protein [Rutstroemia sp. NJR-2017a WRK4]|nr:transcriptional activator cmr1 protein [Rutstroemia sp. NJR-2017a WRK4]
MDEEQLSTRWLCEYEGCTKSFQRKEHLTRHKLSHTSSTTHICRICRKEFSRSDGLQRHLGRHGQEFKKSSGRSKKACLTCHSSKIKCDGNEPCSRCSKKGIPCKYLPNQGPARRDEGSNGDATGNAEYVEPLTAIRHSEGQATTTDIPFSSNPSPSTEFLESTRNIQSAHSPSSNIHALPPALQNPSGNLVDWTKLTIRKEASQDAHSSHPDITDKSLFADITASCKIPAEAMEKYRKLYFSQFHDHWPIIHAPTYDDYEEGSTLIMPAILMIGGWIEGSTTSCAWALELYKQLTSYIVYELSEVQRIDLQIESIPVVLYEIALLSMIFGLYCNVVHPSFTNLHKHTHIAKALVVRNLLSAAMHDNEIFTADTIYPEDKPGYFPPLRLVRQGQRHRVAIYLLKIDTYFSIIKGQAPLLRPEELHFEILPTHAMWHTDGLDILQSRYADEPKARSQLAISKMIEDHHFDTMECPEQAHTLEDLQLCLWGMQTPIWQLSNQIRDTDTIVNLSLNIQKETLRQQLERLKRGLLKLSIKLTAEDILEQPNTSPARYYFGVETFDEPGWQDIVVRRIALSIYTSSILYHLLNIQLLSNIRALQRLAKDPSLTRVKAIFGEKYSEPHAQRESATRTWIQISDARRSLWHAVEILLIHNKIASTPLLADSLLDPISYIALCTAALIVWTHCMYGQDPCESVLELPILPHETGTSIQLTKLSETLGGSSYDEKWKETWVESGALFRPAIENVQLCRCNIGILMGKFEKYIPEGWETKDEIAPGIFRAQVCGDI